jgi:NAD(P)-dependent dehydrogenase (short-subunit alcohol dehydrogenase family)
MDRLKGRAALVTGAGGGIGKAIAARFAAEGARVAIWEIDQAKADAAAREIGAGAMGLQADVAEEAQIAAALGRTLEAFGRLDIAVNNAIRMFSGPLLDLPRESFEGILRVGLIGTFLVARAAARHMAQAEGGTIVNIASNAGVQPYPGSGGYSACKAAVIVLTKQMSLEWARHKIRVNAICPGHTLTPLTQPMYDDPAVLEGRSQATPLGRIGRPEDTAAAAAYLASDDAEWVTGSVLMVDGGVTHSLFNFLPGRRWA